MAPVAAMTIAMGGCTQNDGVITPLFGSWQLDSIELNGSQDDLNKPDCVWGFQSSVICIMMIEPMHSVQEHWGTWSRSDGEMTLCFDNSDNSTAPGEWPYNPPKIPGFPAGPSRLQLRELQINDRRMKLEYTAPDGDNYVYNLSKMY